MRPERRPLPKAPLDPPNLATESEHRARRDVESLNSSITISGHEEALKSSPAKSASGDHVADRLEVSLHEE